MSTAEPTGGALGWAPIFEKAHSRFIILAQALVFPTQAPARAAGELLATHAGELLGLRFTGDLVLLVDGTVQYAEAEIPIPVGVLSGPGVDASFRFSGS